MFVIIIMFISYTDMYIYTYIYVYCVLCIYVYICIYMYVLLFFVNVYIYIYIHYLVCSVSLFIYAQSYADAFSFLCMALHWQPVTSRKNVQGWRHAHSWHSVLESCVYFIGLHLCRRSFILSCVFLTCLCRLYFTYVRKQSILCFQWCFFGRRRENHYIGQQCCQPFFTWHPQ